MTATILPFARPKTQRCIVCRKPALQDRLCAAHGGLPLSEWPPEKLDRLIADARSGALPL